MRMFDKTICWLWGRLDCSDWYLGHPFENWVNYLESSMRKDLRFPKLDLDPEQERLILQDYAKAAELFAKGEK